MALDVAVPEPPDLANRGLPSEFAGVEDVEAVDDVAALRREELDAVLRDGAWREAFEEWAEYTDLTEAVDVEGVDSLDSPLRNLAETELRELGRTVAEVVEETYLTESGDVEEWSAATFRGVTDTDAESEEL
jgi:hypothetical protein